MVELSGVRKIYDGRCVLDVPSLCFLEGQRYAVIGTNGSGKTTLLQLVAESLKPDTGKIDISECERENRGYMPQKPYIFGFSVLRNVTIALQKGQQSKNDAMAALKMVGMEKMARARGKYLSGGEAQRTAIARMIAAPRKLLILDEPTSATDIAGNDLVESALIKYARATGCILIIATHSPAQAMRLSDTVIMLDDGRIVENGPSAEILREPKSEEGRLFLQHWKLKGK